MRRSSQLRGGLVGSWLIVVGALLAPATTPSAVAQDVAAPPPLSAEERSRLFEQLASEVAELERRGSVLKLLVKLVTPSVVHIEARKSAGEGRVYGRSRTVEEAGSGVVIEFEGKHYVITNRHVIRNASLGNILLRLSTGEELTPKNAWEDQDTDVAVLHVEGESLVPARIGNSDALEIGDFVVAVGSPFGLSHSVTYGILSAKGRRDLELGDGGVRYQDFLQTDAAINPGNSGGPLLNLRGEVVGINTAIASNSGGNEGIGFSIPMNMAMLITRQLITKGEVSRAFLGVTLNSKFNAAAAARLGLPRRAGAHVIRVTPNSPAAEAGLLPDDVILSFNGVRIDDDDHLVNVISLTEIGTEVDVVLFREKKPLALPVRVGDYNEFVAPAAEPVPPQPE